MNLEYIPLLKIQRDLYDIPRGRERFQSYLSTMVDADSNDMKLPLSAMNPMGKEHVAALLDEYLAMDADGLAAAVVTAAASGLASISGEFKATLVIVDDARGGWTDRYSTEYSHRFESKPTFRRGWLTGLLWTSEKPSIDTAREEALAAVYRAAYLQPHGFAVTLGEMLSQEGYATAMAGCTGPTLDVDDLAYTREIMTPLMETTHHPTIMACLFGDAAARSLGYAPQGLSDRAGLALALYEAQAIESLPSVQRSAEHPNPV